MPRGWGGPGGGGDAVGRRGVTAGVRPKHSHARPLSPRRGGRECFGPTVGGARPPRADRTRGACGNAAGQQGVTGRRAAMPRGWGGPGGGGDAAGMGRHGGGEAEAFACAAIIPAAGWARMLRPYGWRRASPPALTGPAVHVGMPRGGGASRGGARRCRGGGAAPVGAGMPWGWGGALCSAAANVSTARSARSGSPERSEPD